LILTNHKITYDAVMKKTSLPPLFPFWNSWGKCLRYPASLLTAISSHYLAALPANMSAFISHMWQNASYRNLKRILALLLCTNTQ